jgi:hypothetical protein
VVFDVFRIVTVTTTSSRRVRLCLAGEMSTIMPPVGAARQGLGNSRTAAMPLAQRKSFFMEAPNAMTSFVVARHLVAVIVVSQELLL